MSQPSRPYEELRKQPLKFYLFGKHVSKSKAPLLFNTLFKELGLEWTYEPYDTDSKEQFNEVVDGEKCIGGAITMPNKVEFLSEVDLTDEIGTGVGAINTVYIRKVAGMDLKIGTNTDTVGIKEAFLQTKEALPYVEKGTGKPGLVYGGGGASRSAVYALYKFFGCKTVYVVNRFQSEVDELKKVFKKSTDLEIIYVANPEEAKKLELPVLAVSCVPDFEPSTEEEKLAKSTIDYFKNNTKGALIEMCYHPVAITKLYKEFESAGWIVIGGVVPMIYQGFAQLQLWGGYDLSELPAEKATETVLASL